MTARYNRIGQCQGKRHYRSRVEANAAKAAILARNPDATLNVYRCPHCGWFHVGNSVKRKRRQNVEE